MVIKYIKLEKRRITRYVPVLVIYARADHLEESLIERLMERDSIGVLVIEG